MIDSFERRQSLDAMIALWNRRGSPKPKTPKTALGLIPKKVSPTNPYKSWLTMRMVSMEPWNMTMRLGDSVMKDTRKSSSGNMTGFIGNMFGYHVIWSSMRSNSSGVPGGRKSWKVMAIMIKGLWKPIVSPLSSGNPPLPLSGWWGWKGLGWDGGEPWKNLRQLHPLLSLHCFKFGRTKYTLRLGNLWWIFQRSLVSEEGRLKGETWKLYPWRVVNYRPKMSQMRYVKSIYFQMVECFVFCFCMSVCALFGIGSCLLVNVFDTSKLWDYAFESLTLRRLWLLFFLFAHESNMQVMIVSEHEPIVSMIVYNGINCLNWIAKTYVR